MPPMQTHGTPPSLWLSRPGAPQEVETAVIGGGIVGLSTAWWLARSGHRPVVLEAGALAGRASGRNAGFMLTGTAEPLARLDGDRRRAALALWHASLENRELLRRELLEPGRVECGFLPEGSWIAAVGSKQEEELALTVELLRGDGVTGVEWRDAAAVHRASGSPHLGGAIHQPRDGGLDPVRLCRGIAATGGFETRTGFRVTGLEQRGERVLVASEAGHLLAERVVLALNAYAPRLLPELAAEVQPVRGQMLATEPGERRLTGVWYLNDGFEYARQLADGTFVLGGRRSVAVDVEVGYLQTPTATVQGALDLFLAEAFPYVAGRAVRHRWAGTMAFTAEGVPRIGTPAEVPGAVYAAGFCGHGMSLGFLAGRHLARRVWDEDGDGEVFLPGIAPGS